MKDFDANIIAEHITNKYKGIRSSQRYEEVKDIIIDITMSCDKEEQIEYMKFYMVDAIRKDTEICKSRETGIYEKRYTLAVQFLVAFDLI